MASVATALTKSSTAFSRCDLEGGVAREVLVPRTEELTAGLEADELACCRPGFFELEAVGACRRGSDAS